MKCRLLAALLLVAEAASAGPELHPLELRSYGGLHVADYSTVGGGTETFLAERASVGGRLVGPLRLRVDGLFGRFSEGTWVAAGAFRPYVRLASYSLGASYGYTRLRGGIHSHMLALHGEAYEAAWLTVSGSVGRELKSFGDDLGFAELWLRTYPSERWVLAAGASYAVSNLKQTRADILLRGEWTFWSSRALSAAAFAQWGGNLSTRAAVGISLYFDGDGAAVRERRDALATARFD
jgi:hypothetical protein